MSYDFYADGASAAADPALDGYHVVDPSMESMPSAHAPTTLLGTILNYILSIPTKGAVSADAGLRFAHWRAELTDSALLADPLQQYIRAYDIITQLLQWIPRTFGKTAWGLGRPKTLADIVPGGVPKQIQLFIDICHRDRAEGKQLTEVALAPAGSSGLVVPSLPSNAPLCFLPTRMIGVASKFSSAVAWTLPVCHNDSVDGLLIRPLQLKDLVKHTSCEHGQGFECASYRWASNPEWITKKFITAHLLVNPLLRDRVLHHWQCSLRATPLAPPAERIPPDVLARWPLLTPSSPYRAERTFHPANPFQKMQEFILEMETEFNQRGGSLLGSFKPITAPKQYPIPLFIDEDGNLLAFLWHGTKSELSQPIAETGFLNSCSAIALYGRGTYTTISACKALQYADAASPNATLLLCAVFLGKNPYFTRVKGEEKPAWATAKIAAPGIARFGSQLHWEFISFNEADLLPMFHVNFGTRRVPIPTDMEKLSRWAVA